MSSNLSFSNGILDYKAKTGRDTVYLPSDSVIVEKEVPVPVEVKKEINVLTKWQAIRMRAGDLLLMLLASFVGWKLIKWYLNIKKT